MVTTDKQHIIDNITSSIAEKLPASQVTLFSEFTRQYLNTVALQDLQNYSDADLLGLMSELWYFIYQRKEGAFKVRAYNPVSEKHGWQSNSTILEVSCSDRPFLVDSIVMEIERLNYVTNFIIHIGGLLFSRNDKDQIIEVLSRTHTKTQVPYEAVLHFELNRIVEQDKLEELVFRIEKVLTDVRIAVDDWQHLKTSMRQCIDDLTELKDILPRDEVNEAKDFLSWLSRDHFIFLGCRLYKLVGEGENKALEIVPNTSLGVLRDTSKSVKTRVINDMPAAAKEQILSKNILIIAKTNTISTIHRPVYTDYIGVKQFDKKGKVTGEFRFIGLYTSIAYNTSPRHIPLLRRKVIQVMLMSGLLPTSHAAKSLLNILETLPRDDVFQASIDELYELGMGIYYLQDRRLIRLFARYDIYGRFVSCLVYLPRDQINTQLRKKLEAVLLKEFSGKSAAYSTRLTESLLGRIHFVIRIDSKKAVYPDVNEVEKKLIEAARSWEEHLNELLIEHSGKERGGQLANLYLPGFPASYRERFEPRNAVYDIEYIELLSDDNPISMSLYRKSHDENTIIHFKLFQRHDTFTISDVLPIFENFGLRVIAEQPYEIMGKDNITIWINDFRMTHANNLVLDIDAIKKVFKEAFASIWFGLSENDGFNELILNAKLEWRKVAIIRAYAKYLRQIGFIFNQSYIEDALVKNANITSILIELFYSYFDCKNPKEDKKQSEILANNIKKHLEEVASLDHDRIIRRFLDIIQATLRTNFFQVDTEGKPKSYISFKLKPSDIPDMPLPLPAYEIFVYSPRFEGVHLRSAKVARGGLRWSDRREDFRTEVLGLMKAQRVKNAVIVPAGAKGGFVTKTIAESLDRSEVMYQVISCYKDFIRGLLDITDNLINDKVSPPKNVIRYDDDDSYLVVAADKGTASFSDIANEVAQEYDFWLGDAFASGGSMGYDHKKMGITARGAWESVKRHFSELNKDIQKEHFSVVGIGDLMGDVFGNGMLQSEHIKLIAAFNHQHIFIDPNPDAFTSYQERKRIFELPRSTWADYDIEKISKGGGVFRRDIKFIKLSEEIKARFDLESDYLTPNELISGILKAKYELLWNGGIGTFVKSSQEQHTEVGDRLNDSVRVNGADLRCKVVGEGGNLGLTQLARIEFAQKGGLIFTDFIDNSGGVDCSDLEVNIKILLNDILSQQEMTFKQRNKLLVDMQDDVAKIVLRHNYYQSLSISRATHQAEEYFDLYTTTINQLCASGILDRELEFLPDEKALAERKADNIPLTRPEICVLFAYSKNNLKTQLLESGFLDEEDLFVNIKQALPDILSKKYSDYLKRHRLRREIIATQISNVLINEMSFTFVSRLQAESGALISDIVKAYLISRRIFDLAEINDDFISLGTSISAKKQAELYVFITSLLRRSSRWFLRNRRADLNITNSVDEFHEGIQKLKTCLPELLTGIEKKKYDELLNELLEANVSNEVASNVAISKHLYSSLDIVAGSKHHNFDLLLFTRAYYKVGEFLELDWLREQITNLSVVSNWQAIARANYRDDLDSLQHTLTIGVLKRVDVKSLNIEDCIDDWYKLSHASIIRWRNNIADIRSDGVDYTKLYIITRELFDLAISSFP